MRFTIIDSLFYSRNATILCSVRARQTHSPFRLLCVAAWLWQKVVLAIAQLLGNAQNASSRHRIWPKNAYFDQVFFSVFSLCWYLFVFDWMALWFQENEFCVNLSIGGNICDIWICIFIMSYDLGKITVKEALFLWLSFTLFPSGVFFLLLLFPSNKCCC